MEKKLLLLLTLWGGILLGVHPVWAQEGQILYYNFQDRESALIRDASGRENDGIVRNYDEDRFTIEQETIKGKTVHALKLSGGKEGSYVELPENILKGCSEVTVTAWVNLIGNSYYQRIWDFGNRQESYLYLLSNGNNENAAGYAAAITRAGWVNEQTLCTGWNFPRNQWVFTAVTIKDSRMSLYLDGELMGTRDTGIPLAEVNTTKDNYLGYGQFGDDPAAGSFAEVAVFNYEMEQGEIKELCEQVILQKPLEDLTAEEVLYNYYINYEESPGSGMFLMGEENPLGKSKGKRLGEYLSYLVKEYERSQNPRTLQKLESILVEMYRLQKKSPFMGWKEGFFSLYTPEEWLQLEEGKCYPDSGIPWVEQGKLLKGLLDIYQLTQDGKSMQIAVGIADWLLYRLQNMEENVREMVWNLSISGRTGDLGNQLCILSMLCGDKKYLEGAKAFLTKEFTESVEQRKYDFRNQCAERILEQAVLALRLDSRGESVIRGNAGAEIEVLWSSILEKYTYASGEPGMKGYFPDEMQRCAGAGLTWEPDNEAMDDMLLLTRLLYERNPNERKYMDYYERVLLNLYYGQWDMAASEIFFAEGNRGYVNLYIPGEFRWEEKGLVFHQKVNMEKGKAIIRVTGADDDTAGKADLLFRIPSYANDSMQIKKNGSVMEKNIKNNYIFVESVNPGDIITIFIEYAPYLSDPLEVHEDYRLSGFMYGPFLMGSTQEHNTEIQIMDESLSQLRVEAKGGELRLMWENICLQPYHLYSEEMKTIYYKVFCAPDGNNTKWHRVSAAKQQGKRGTLEVDKGVVSDGGTVMVTASPREGYLIETVHGNGRELERLSDNIYVLKNVREDTAIEGRFRMINPNRPNPAELEQTAEVNAHYTASWENLEGIKNKDFQPKSSNEGMGKGWGDWKQESGSEVWVEYSWEVEVPMNTCAIYWYDDNQNTGAPQKLEIQYLDGNDQWHPVRLVTKNKDMFGLDKYNTISFQTVRSRKLRLQMHVAEDKQAVGIYRWNVSEQVLK